MEYTHTRTHSDTHRLDGGLGFVLKLLAVCLVLHRLHLLLIACDWRPLNPIHTGAAGRTINTGSRLFLPLGCWINDALGRHTHSIQKTNTIAHTCKRQKENPVPVDKHVLFHLLQITFNCLNLTAVFKGLIFDMFHINI